jgi:hypothetical protein
MNECDRIDMAHKSDTWQASLAIHGASMNLLAAENSYIYSYF